MLKEGLGRLEEGGGSCVGWGPMGGLGGNHSSENGSAVKEGPDCIGTACEREQHAQPNQSDIRKEYSYQRVMAHLTITQAQNCSI